MAPDGALRHQILVGATEQGAEYRHRRRFSARSYLVSREYTPCVNREFRLASSPSGVLGPVLLPPCIRQRLFFIAGP